MAFEQIKSWWSKRIIDNAKRLDFDPQLNLTLSNITEEFKKFQPCKLFKDELVDNFKRGKIIAPAEVESLISAIKNQINVIETLKKTPTLDKKHIKSLNYYENTLKNQIIKLENKEERIKNFNDYFEKFRNEYSNEITAINKLNKACKSKKILRMFNNTVFAFMVVANTFSPMKSTAQENNITTSDTIPVQVETAKKPLNEINFFGEETQKDSVVVADTLETTNPDNLITDSQNLNDKPFRIYLKNTKAVLHGFREKRGIRSVDYKGKKLNKQYITVELI